MISRLKAFWRWLPVIIRAPLTAFVVFEISSTLSFLPLAGNMKFLPQIPWAFPASLILLAACWYYLAGGGPPASTQTARQDVTRARSLPGPVWRESVLPILLTGVMVMSLRLLLPSLVPMEASRIAERLSPYSFATVLGMLLSIAVSAGVTEEISFRGYLQKPLEDAYGIIPAIVITGIAFWLAHADKVTATHLPFHMTVSILLGLLAYLTKSLLPSMIAHAAGDAILLPAYCFQKPSFAWAALTARPVWESGAPTFNRKLAAIWHAMALSNFGEPGRQTFAILAWIFIVSTILTVLAFRRLARISRLELTQIKHEGTKTRS